VLLLEREGEAVDDTSKNLKQFGNSVVLLILIDEGVESVVDCFSDEGAEGHELGVNAVEDCLEIVSLSGIFRVEQLENVQDKEAVDVLLENFEIHVVGSDEAQEELVHDLKMGPGRLEGGLLILGVQNIIVEALGKCAEDVCGHHLQHLDENGLGDEVASLGNVVDKLKQQLTLDLLGSNLICTLGLVLGMFSGGFPYETRFVIGGTLFPLRLEFEDDRAKPQFLHKEIRSLGRGG